MTTTAARPAGPARLVGVASPARTATRWSGSRTMIRPGSGGSPTTWRKRSVSPSRGSRRSRVSSNWSRRSQIRGKPSAL